MRLPVDPVSAIPALMAPGIEGMGERLVRFTLDTLRDPEARDDLMSLARTGVSAGHAGHRAPGVHRDRRRGSGGRHDRRPRRADALGADHQLPAGRGDDALRGAPRAAGLSQRRGGHPDGGAGHPGPARPPPSDPGFGTGPRPARGAPDEAPRRRPAALEPGPSTPTPLRQGRGAARMAAQSDRTAPRKRADAAAPCAPALVIPPPGSGGPATGDACPATQGACRGPPLRRRPALGWRPQPSGATGSRPRRGRRRRRPWRRGPRPRRPPRRGRGEGGRQHDHREEGHRQEGPPRRSPRPGRPPRGGRPGEHHDRGRRRSGGAEARTGLTPSGRRRRPAAPVAGPSCSPGPHRPAARPSARPSARRSFRRPPGLSSRIRRCAPQRPSNSRATVIVVAWSTRPSCHATVAASTAFST